MFNAGIGVMF